MRVLFVTPRVPFPTRVGYQVRAVEQLLRLGRSHRVTLLAFEEADAAACEAMRERLRVERVVAAEGGALGRGVGVARALISGEPLQSGIFDTRGFARVIGELVAAAPGFDLVHVQLARLAPAVERALPPALPRVLDLIDSLSFNMRQRAERDAWLVGRLAAEESRRLGSLEQALLGRWDHVTAVTERDRLAIGAHPRLSVNRNGVDGERFSPGATPRGAGSVIFTGNLGYFPNVDAACWLLDEVWPRVLRERPDAFVRLVGARPHRRVRHAARRSTRVELVGPVDDLAASLRASEVAVAPLRAGSGQPLKVLEALASGTPVVATPAAIAGLAIEDGQHLLVAGEADSFAAAVVRALNDRELRAWLSCAGRGLVEREHGWDAPVAALDALWRDAAERRRRGGER